MNRQKRHPRWRQLSLLIPLMMGLLLVDAHMQLSPLAHQTIEAGVVLLMYGSMACWLWANQAALESEAELAEPRRQATPLAEQTQDDLSWQAWVEQAIEEPHQRTESTLSTAELQQV